MATKTARAKITFECTECKHRNYDTIKNKKTILTDSFFPSIVLSAKSTPNIKNPNNRKRPFVA